MRTLFLSFMFLVGLSFTGIQTTATASNGCTNCFEYANYWESHYFGDERNDNYWNSTLDYCHANLNPCSTMLDPADL